MYDFNRLIENVACSIIMTSVSTYRLRCDADRIRYGQWEKFNASADQFDWHSIIFSTQLFRILANQLINYTLAAFDYWMHFDAIDD